MRDWPFSMAQEEVENEFIDIIAVAICRFCDFDMIGGNRNGICQQARIAAIRLHNHPEILRK